MTASVIDYSNSHFAQPRRLTEESSLNSVDKLNCLPEGDWPRTRRGDHAILPCGDSNYFYGTLSRACLDNDYPNWDEPVNGCMRYTCQKIADQGQIFPSTSVYSFYSLIDETNNIQYLKFCQGDQTWGTTEVLDLSNVCPEETFQDNIWPSTTISSTRSIPCGMGATGSLTRQCTQNGWSSTIENTCQPSTSHVVFEMPEDVEYLSSFPIVVTCSNQPCKVDTSKITHSNDATILYTLSDSTIAGDFGIIIRRLSTVVDIVFNEGSFINTYNEIISVDIKFPYVLHVHYNENGYISETFEAPHNHLASGTTIEPDNFGYSHNENAVHIVDQPLILGNAIYDINHTHKYLGTEYGEVTLMFWFKLEFEGAQLIASLHNDFMTGPVSDNDFTIYIDDFGMLHIHTGPYDQCDVTGFIPAVNTWNHIGLIYKSDINGNTAKTIIINGQLLTCPATSEFFSVVGRQIQLSSGQGLSVSRLFFYKTALASSLIQKEFNENSESLLIYQGRSTSYADYKLSISFTFSDSVSTHDLTKATLIDTELYRTISITWDTTNPSEYIATLQFPRQNYNYNPVVVLNIDEGFAVSSSNTNVISHHQKFIIEYDHEQTVLVSTSPNQPYIANTIPTSGTIPSGQSIKLVWDQDVICSNNLNIVYRESEEFYGILASDTFYVYSNYIEIIPPAGLLSGHNVYFIIEAGVCTDLSGNQLSLQYRSPDSRFIVDESTSSYTGELHCEGENNEQIDSLMIRCDVTYDRIVSFTNTNTKIRATEAKISYPTINGSTLSFYVYPTLTVPSKYNDPSNLSTQATYIPISYTITIDAAIAKDLAAVPTYSAPLIKTIQSYYNPILRVYKFLENGNNFFENSLKNCVIPISPEASWVENYDNTYGAYLFSNTRGSFICKNAQDVSFVASVPEASLTIQFWYFVESDDIETTFIEKSFSNGDIDYKIYLKDSKIYVQTASQGMAQLLSTDALNSNYWHQVTLSIVSSSNYAKIILYLDGIYALNSEVILNKSYSTGANSVLYIGSNNNVRMSEVIFFAYKLSEEAIKSNFEQYGSPIISFMDVSTPSCGPISIQMSTNKQTVGLTLSDLLISDPSVVKAVITPSPSNLIYSITLTPLLNKTISFQVKEAGLYSLYNKPSYASEILFFNVGVCIDPRPYLYWKDPLPAVRNYNKFEIDFTDNEYPLTISNFASTYGVIKELTISGRKVSGYFVLTMNTPYGTVGTITYDQNVCGENQNEPCIWSIEFAYQFTGVYASDYSYNSIINDAYKQMLFNAKIDSGFVLTADVACTEKVRIGYRQVNTNKGYTCMFYSATSTKVVCYPVSKTYIGYKTFTIPFRTTTCDDTDYISIWMKVQGNTLSFGRGNYLNDNYESVIIDNQSNSDENVDYYYVFHTSDYNPLFLENMFAIDIHDYPVDDGSDNTFIPIIDDINAPHTHDHDQDDGDDDDTNYKLQCMKNTVYIDTTTNLMQGSITFQYELSDYHLLNRCSFNCKNCIVNNVTQSNTLARTYLFTFSVLDLEKDYRISLPSGKVCQNKLYSRVCNCRSYYVGNVRSENVDRITAELTWNSEANMNVLPVYVTLTMNRYYTAKLEDFIVDKGGRILHFEPNNHGGIIAVVPTSYSNMTSIPYFMNHFEVRVKSHLYEEGQIYSPSASLSIDTIYPTGLSMDFCDLSDTIFTEYWKGYEHGLLDFSLTIHGTGELHVDLSPSPQVISSIYRVHLDNSVYGKYVLQRRTTISTWDTIYDFTSLKAIGSLNTFRFTYINSVLTITILQGDNYAQDTVILSYNCGSFKPLYFGLSENCMTLYASDITVYPPTIVDAVDEGKEWKYLPIYVQDLNSIENFPIVIQVQSNITVPLEKWVCFNGNMFYGNQFNEFYYYPSSFDGKSAFYLESHIPNDENIITRTSAVYLSTFASRINSIIMPKQLNNVEYPIYSELFRFTKNTLNMIFTAHVHTENTLKMKLYDNIKSVEYSYYELNLCGYPSIRYIYNNKEMIKTTGSTFINCQDLTQTLRVVVTELANNATKVQYYYENMKKKIELSNQNSVATLLPLNLFTFSTSNSFASINMNRPFSEFYCIQNNNMYSDFTTIPGLTVDTCQQMCGQHHEYFGITEGDKCVCYPSIAYIWGKRVDDSSCNTHCSGDSSSICGGNGFISVYATKYVSSYFNQYSFNRVFTKTDSLSYAYYSLYNELQISLYNVGTLTFNNCPLFTMEAPKEYTVSTRFYIMSLLPKQEVGFIVYDDSRSDPVTVCSLIINDDYSVMNINTHNNQNGKGRTDVLPIKRSDSWAWLRLSRDPEGVYSCSYRLNDNTMWKEEILDDSHTTSIGALVGVYALLGPNRSISFSDFTFTTDYERAFAMVDHNLQNEINKKEHILSVSFTENFEVYTNTAFELTNAAVTDVVPISYNQYDVFIKVKSPGTFMFMVPKDVSGDLSEQGNYATEPIYSTYTPEYIAVVLSFYGLSSNQDRIILVTFSKPIVSLSTSDFIMTNLVGTQIVQLDSNSYHLYVQFTNVNPGTIIMPDESVYSSEGITNMASNQLTLKNTLYCKGVLTFDSRGLYYWPQTSIGGIATRDCPDSYTGYTYRKCNSNGEWEDEVLSQCILKQCAEVTEFGYDWPATTISTSYTHFCPFGQEGAITRPCTYTNKKAVWGTVSNNCTAIVPSSSVAIRSILEETHKLIDIDLDIAGTVSANSPSFPVGLSLRSDPVRFTGLSINSYEGNHVAKIIQNNNIVTLYLSVVITEHCVYNNTIYQDNELISYPCDHPYTGTITKICKKNDCCYSSWHDYSNTCVPLQCNEETDSLFNVHWNSAFIGETVEQSCPNGLEGTLTRVCHEDQSWGSVSGTCSSPQCSENTDSKWNLVWGPVNANTVSEQSCPNGLVGKLTRKCDENKEWEAVVGTCETPKCLLDVDNVYGYIWKESNIGATIYKQCPTGTVGTLSRTCNLNGQWDAIVGECITQAQECPSEIRDILDNEYIFPVTPAGSTASVPCGNGFVTLDCLINGEWNTTANYGCISCKPGEQKVYLDDEHVNFICQTCKAGKACNNDEITDCTGNNYSHAGSSECSVCTGHVIANKNGNIDCVICTSDEIFINDHCEPVIGCVSEVMNGVTWPSINVGTTATAPCQGENVVGEMSRVCLDADADSTTNNGVWDKVNMDNCVVIPSKPGHKYIQFALEYHKVPQNIYDQDEAHYDNVRAFVQTFAYQLSFLHTIDIGEGIHTPSTPGVEESHVFTRLNLTIGVQQNNDVDTFLRSNLNTQVKNVRRLDDITYHYDYYIMIQDEAPVYQFNAYCYNEEYGKKVTVGDYLYTPCQNPATTTDITMVGEVASLCDFDYQLGVAYFRKVVYKGCKPIYPAVANHVFIDMFYQVKYTVASNYYCSAITKFFKRYLQWADTVVFDYDVHTFKNVTIDGHIATQFTVRFETTMRDTLKLKEHLMHVSEPLYDLIFTNIPEILNPDVSILMPLDSTTNITYFTQDKQERRLSTAKL